ncbi:MAG: phosphotransferase [Chloroflexota bacterium]
MAHDIDQKTAVSLITSQFPHLRPVVAELLGMGWDNVVWRVNGRFAFRFPRRPIGVDCLQAELALLPTLAPLLPLPVVAPTLLGQPGQGYPWPFAGYALLPGQMAYTVGLTAAARNALAVPLAHFLQTLHAFPPEQARALGAPPDRLGRFAMATRVPQLQQLLQELVARGVLPSLEPWLGVITAVSPSPTQAISTPQVLVHGDLNVRNFLLDEAGQISGVIDWGDLHVGNPAADLALACSFLPPVGQAIFRQTYGAIDDETWRLAQFRGLHLTAVLLGDAITAGDAALAQECRLGLQYILGA